MHYHPTKHMEIVSSVRQKYKEKHGPKQTWTNKEIVRIWQLCDSFDEVIAALYRIADTRTPKNPSNLKALIVRAIRIEFERVMGSKIHNLSDQQLIVLLMQHWNLVDRNLFSVIMQKEKDVDHRKSEGGTA